MIEPKALSSRELMELFKSRGMIISEQDVDKINHINYYKLKEFAHPLSRVKKEKGIVSINYEGISFQEVLRRYYQDKNLRLYLLHAIEKIEVSIKTNISHVMGLKYGAFGYLNFRLWAHREKYTRFEIEEKQHYLKKSILYYKGKRNSPDYNRKENNDIDGFPTVWLAIDLLTFGDIVNMLDMMNSAMLKRIASVYQTKPEEFLSWIKCLHFIRNICAHNSNLIDVKLKTKPKYRKEWMEYLYLMTSKGGLTHTPSNRLAVVICIVVSLVNVINPRYNWYEISKSIRSLCCDEDDRANLLGFKSADVAGLICKNIKEASQI